MSPPAPSQGDDFAEVVVVRHGETSGNASRIIQVGSPVFLSCSPDRQLQLEPRKILPFSPLDFGLLL
jgi:hypothetical protein